MELRPPTRLAAEVATVWVRRAGDTAVRYTDIPDGTVGLSCRAGGAPEVSGPLTAPRYRTLDAGGVEIGLRFRPGAAAVLGVPPYDLVDVVLTADQLLGPATLAAGDQLQTTGWAGTALATLCRLVASRRDRNHLDPVIIEAVGRLRCRPSDEVALISRSMAMPERSFRRRVRQAVGLSPKPLQTMLRFQGLLGRAQRAAATGRPVAANGLAALAVDSGYADQPHLTRECVRLTGEPPARYFGDLVHRCSDHDHRAAYAR